MSWTAITSFRSYPIARYARDLKLDPRLALAQVQVSRAFTCYQLAEIVERLSHRAETLSLRRHRLPGLARHAL